MDKNKLLVLNTLVQNIESIEGRVKYLESLGKMYFDLTKSDSFFIDKRDYNIYSVIKIGAQTWLGENLRYKGVESNFNPNHFNLNHGRFYYWEDALTACPKGWELPSETDWQILERYIGISQEDIEKRGADRKNDKATLLKSKFGWSKDKNGSDLYNFSALATGDYNFHSQTFHAIGELTHFWSSTQEDINDEVWIRALYFTSNSFDRGTYPPDWDMTFSCRCIKKLNK